MAAAFGRLCVETPNDVLLLPEGEAAAFGRLCVETPSLRVNRKGSVAAAFGRLCVETFRRIALWLSRTQPPSGGCVLKLISIDLVTLKSKQPPSGGCVLKRC